MVAAEAIFSTGFGIHCRATEFIEDFIKAWGLIVFMDDGFI